MNIRMQSIRTAALALVLAAGTAAQAQLFRSYLSPTGADSNPCTLQAPCRLLPAALNAVADGGEVWILASANYNVATVNVAKSVTILAIPGAVGSVVATGGTGAIAIATPGVRVALRNLVIMPLATSPGPDGIVMSAGDKLTLENCVVSRLSNRALYVGTGATVRVIDSFFRDNLHGMYFEGGANVEVARTTIVGSTNGISLFGDVATTTTSAAVSDTVIAGGGTAVASISHVASSQVHASVARTTVTGNTLGFSVQSTAAGSATATLSRSFVGGNATFFQQSGTGALMRSLGDNHVDGINSTGTLTSVPRT
jgi:hypothetical protein